MENGNEKRPVSTTERAKTLLDRHEAGEDVYEDALDLIPLADREHNWEACSIAQQIVKECER